LSGSASIPRVVALSIAAMFGLELTQAVVWAGAARQAGNTQTAEQLIKASDCASCHAADRTVVGPAYAAIAKKYAGTAGAAARLALRIRDGSTGTWGDGKMPPHPDLTDAQRQTIARYILAVKDAPAARAPVARRYAYALPDGKKITLDFPLYVEGGGKKVTKDIFRGYALFNSYCFRCHGTDATESELGPNLRHSLEIGMTQRQFMSVAMTGREDKGMPTWAGFLTPEEMTSIYRYVKARSVGLLPTGRPPSETD
jgi:cytochrome c